MLSKRRERPVQALRSANVGAKRASRKQQNAGSVLGQPVVLAGKAPSRSRLPTSPATQILKESAKIKIRVFVGLVKRASPSPSRAQSLRAFRRASNEGDAAAKVCRLAKRRPILAYWRANAFKRRRLRRNTRPRRVEVVDWSPCWFICGYCVFDEELSLNRRCIVSAKLTIIQTSSSETSLS